MYKVLIVDDEKLAREYLNAVIDWKAFNLEVVAMAKDGLEAIELMKIRKIDIMLMDIVMPTVDGIALAQYIRENDLSVQIVVISGIDSFEIARKTIKLNVKDYLLKPFEVVELENTLRNIVKELETEQIQIIKNIKQIAYDLIVKNDNPVIPNFCYDKLVNTYVGSCFIKQDFIKQGFFKLISNNPNSVIIYQEKNDFYNFLIIENGDELKKNIYDLFKNFSSIVLIEDNIFCSDIKSKAHFVIDKINDVILYRTTFRRLETMQLIDREYALNEIIDVEKLFFYVKTKNNNLAISLINDFIIKIKNLNLNSKSSYKLISDLYSYFETFSSNENKNKQWYEHKSWIEIKENFQKLVNVLIQNDNRETIPLTKQKALVNNVNKYIEEHLGDSTISNDSIAKEFNVASAYLRRTYKNITNNTITNYLIEKRCEKAKALLRKRCYIHSDIAFKVGYNDPAYFSKSFKKVTGMTPKEYELFSSNL